jgi:hypothetical protein
LSKDLSLSKGPSILSLSKGAPCTSLASTWAEPPPT